MLVYMAIKPHQHWLAISSNKVQSIMALVQQVLVVFLCICLMGITNAQLTPNFYDKVCPEALSTVRDIVAKAIDKETRMGASLLRLHFHDCFVNGCDGSVLLDDTANFTGEKTANPNINSIRGFEVIDNIKRAVNQICKKNMVSCADILAIAARDSINILGGAYYKVLLGRRDARTASRNDANNDLPAPFFSFSQLVSNFKSHGLDLTDLIALSGGHTIGLARCTTFRSRIYNDTNINASFAASQRQNCPVTGGDNNTEPLDSTTKVFDNQYFNDLRNFKGLLHSDQELFKNDGSDSDKLVKKFAYDSNAFDLAFKNSMIKMGNLKPLVGNKGEIRFNCRKIN